MCPFYDYECKDCNYIYEELVNELDRDVQRCPMCNKHTTRMLSVGNTTIVNNSEDGVTRKRRPRPTKPE